MTQKERLLKLLYEMHYGQSRFEEEIGASRGCIAHMGDFVSQNFLRKIANRFPDVRTDWIITGLGEMYNSTPPKEDAVPTEKKYIQEEIVAQRLVMEKLLAQVDKLNATIAECQRSINSLTAML